MKNFSKNLLTILLALALVISFFPSTAQVEASDVTEAQDEVVFDDDDDFTEYEDEDSEEEEGDEEEEPIYTEPDIPRAEGSYLVSIDALKDTVDYETGDDLDLDDIYVTAYFSDGSSEDIDFDSCDSNIDEIDMDEAGTQTITISYTVDEITATCEIEIYIEEAIVLEEIKATKSKTSYYVGDKISISDLKVVAYYSDGSKEVLDSDDYETNVKKLKTTKAGTLTLEVTYEEDDEEVSDEITLKVSVKKPGTPAKVSLTGGIKTFSVSYNKVSSAAGYAITYSTSSKFKSAKTIYTKAVKATVKNLKAGTYYVKVSAYVMSGKKRITGAASSTQKVKVTAKTKAKKSKTKKKK